MTKIVGIGPHYQSVLDAKGMACPEKPFTFIKPTSSIIRSGSSIVIPAVAEQVMSEVEVAIRVSRKLKNATREEVEDLSAIDGYAIANDVTANGEGVFGAGKIYDTFTPLGDFVMVSDPTSVTIEAFLNGEKKQSATTKEMNFDFAAILVYFSGIFTLEPGDIILTGTPASAFPIQAGDKVELRSPELGTVVTPVQSA